MDKKLEVRNLSISFHTNNGTVKAVRDISFTLNRGETLAIVGESGSGKSVTAKAILGILAANSIVEGGEIIYDGQDLLKISEESFNEIRGHRISMIYQDPLSSLDPIMKIGKQMTEATIINGKTARKHGKKSFEAKCRQLLDAMKAGGMSEAEASAVIDELKKIMPAGAKRTNNYLSAHDYASAAVLSCEQLAVALRKEDAALIADETKWLKERLERSRDEALMDCSELDRLSAGLPDTLSELQELLQQASAQETPDFYAQAAGGREYEARVGAGLECALRHAYTDSASKKRTAIEALDAALPLFEAKPLDIKVCSAALKQLLTLVDDATDKVTVSKNSAAYTFASTMNASMVRYRRGITNNPKEERRVARQTRQREKELARKGDAPKVVPAVLVDLELTQETMVRAIREVADSFRIALDRSPDYSYTGDASAMLSWLKSQAERMETHVSDREAYDKAIQIMENVGIAEPRKRFDQYPFEFSGGMRQRIVIAIAVAANPDILICDEPTTALDVTIQAQILELINDLKRKRNLTVIFITHDLGVVANIADRVAVMYAGKLVEYGTADEVFYEPVHPYTWALLSSMPDLDTEDRLEFIPGTPPNMIYPPEGDAFAARNRYALAIDLVKEPPKFWVSDTHWAATWLLHPKAPKIEMPQIIVERIARMKELNREADERGE